MIFPDPGFHLAVLNALLDDGTLSEEELGAQLADVSSDDDEGPRIRAAIRRLHSYELPDEGVATIDRIDFDGGNTVYMLIEETLGVDTGGEADYYELRSLQSVEQLSALESLDLDGHGYRKAALDLAPLANHPTLSSFRPSGKCTNAQALESLSALQSLSVGLATLDDPQVLDRLAQRGVIVER